MIDFAPTEEQAAIRDLARQVAIEQFRKQARAAERVGAMPAAVRTVLSETGLLAPFPEEYGGSGVQDAVTHALITEELAYGDGGLALNLIGSILAPLAVLIAGDEAQRLTFLPFCLSKESTVGLSELATGFELRQMSSVLHDTGGGWDLAINKRGVVHGRTTDLQLVVVRLESSKAAEGWRVLALPDDMQIIEVRNEEHLLGLRAAPRARWQMSPDDAESSIVLGGLEHGGAGAERFVALANVLLGALAVGIARAALEYASEYARGRVQFGKPISSYQAIAFMAAEMAMDVDAARFLLWRAAQTWDADGAALRLAERARMQAVKTALRVTTDAVQILGGAGFLQDHPVEMWMRDAAALAALG